MFHNSSSIYAISPFATVILHLPYTSSPSKGVAFPIDKNSSGLTVYFSFKSNTVKFAMSPVLIPVLMSNLFDGFMLKSFISVSNLKKIRGYANVKAHVKESCDIAELTLASLSKEIKTLDSKRKKMLKIYKTLKSRPKLNSASIDKLKARFDKVYLEDDKALDV